MPGRPTTTPPSESYEPSEFEIRHSLRHPLVAPDDRSLADLLEALAQNIRNGNMSIIRQDIHSLDRYDHSRIEIEIEYHSRNKKDWRQ